MEFLASATDMVSGAGRYALSRLGQSGDIRYKGDIDPVTEVDKANEAAMLSLIRTHHPGHGVVGEEGTDVIGDGRHRWYLDPLDGTVNFAHGLPWFSVSAALQVDGVTEVGAIYAPATDELFTAVRGQGAFCNGRPIHVSTEDVLKRALLGTGFPYDVGDRVDRIVSPLRVFLARAQGVRRLGSACMDLCQVACGRYDGFWELGLHVWDVAAGFLIVREAGGQVSDFQGRTGDLLTDEVLVSNGHLHSTLLAAITTPS